MKERIWISRCILNRDVMRFIVEKCPIRYESIGSRKFDEHSESEFFVSIIVALRKNLAPKCNVKRSGEWLNIESRNLVPGDLVC